MKNSLIPAVIPALILLAAGVLSATGQSSTAIAGRPTMSHSPASFQVISGTLVDAEDGQPVPYVHIALYDSTGVHLLTGTTSGPDGYFRLEVPATDTLEKNIHSPDTQDQDDPGFTASEWKNPGLTLIRLQIRSVAYETLDIRLETDGAPHTGLGVIRLQPALLHHEEAVIRAVPVHARTESDRTVYYIREELKQISSSGTDLMRYIPGFRVDIMQNIAFEGGREVLILVDNRERDRSFLNQLHPDDIRQVEVLHTPPARYDAETGVVINIVLHDKPASYIAGHLNLDAPTSTSEMYLFPSYNLHYGRGNLRAFTSWNGEFSFFDIEENSSLNEVEADIPSLYGMGSTGRQTIGQMRQNYWSHRFHYGLDYDFGERSELSYYGWTNPWSNEHNGMVISSDNGGYMERSHIDRRDEDRNIAIYHSLHYRLAPARTGGHEFNFSAGYHQLETHNHIRYDLISVTDGFDASINSGVAGKFGNAEIFNNAGKSGNAGNSGGGYRHETITESFQRSYRLKADWSLPVWHQVRMHTGVLAGGQSIRDAAIPDFRYRDEILAAHSSLIHDSRIINMQAGIRTEYFSRRQGSSEAQNGSVTLFPDVSLHFKLPERPHSVRLAYSTSLVRPHLYQLRPGPVADNPYSVHSGNPALGPATTRELTLQYHRMFGDSYLTAKVFSRQESDAIHRLTTLNTAGYFDSVMYNAGDIRQLGLQLSGNIGLGIRSGIQPFVKVADVRTGPHAYSLEMGIPRRHTLSWETGLSAYTGFGNGYTLAASLHYATPLIEIQRSVYESAMYLVSVGKTVGSGGYIGATSGLPLMRKFTYHGYRMEASGFESRTDGNILLSAVPLWISFRYRFSRGNGQDQRNGGDRRRMDDEIAPPPVRKGF